MTLEEMKALKISMEKLIERGIEHRKPYRGAKAVDPWCRNHGNCPSYNMQRKYNNKKRNLIHTDDGRWK